MRSRRQSELHSVYTECNVKRQILYLLHRRAAIHRVIQSWGSIYSCT